MTPYHVLKRVLGNELTLTHAEAAALAPHAELLTDLQLLTDNSRIEPGGRLSLSVLGAGLLSQLSDVSAPAEDSEEDSFPAPGM